VSLQLASRQRSRKLLVLIFLAVLLIALAWYVNRYISLEDLAEQESRVRAYIAANPLQSFVVGFAIYSGLTLVPGTGGKAIVWGWLFGFWQAVTIVTIGLALGAMFIFTLSRYLFQESIERRYTKFVSLMNKHLEKEGAYYLLALRMAHVPYSVINPVCGASRIRAWTFFWTTVAGLIPANAIWVYVGIRLPSLHELASNGAGSFIDLPLIVAMVGSAVLPHLVRWLISRFGIPSNKNHNHDVTKYDL
jgi:uncharacterized membrane protein YdjX (TVP38/TMEM64 family)